MTVHRNQGRLERDAVALADGSLPASRQARVERAIAASPRLRASVDAQRRALTAIRQSGLEGAPAALRARLELARDPRRRWRPGRPIAVSAAASVLAAAGLSTVLIGGGGPGAPTVAAAATLGSRAQAVALHASRGAPPAVAVGIAYPNWSARFGLRALGMRRDRLDGRLATTVFYGNGRQRIAYTIVSGTPLRPGAVSHSTVWKGMPLETLSAGGRVTVSWVEQGHSCVLSATGTPASTLAGLASSEDAPSLYG